MSQLSDPVIEGAERSMARVALAKESSLYGEKGYRVVANAAREAGNAEMASWYDQRANEYASCVRMGSEAIAQLDLAIEARKRMDKPAFEAAMAKARTLGGACSEITERIALESGVPKPDIEGD